MKTLALGLVLSTLLAGSAAAQEETPKDYADVSLENLLDLETVTATQTAQTVRNTPAVMSVLTAQEIENLGVRNLYEALDTLAGVSVVEAFFGYSLVNVRGVLESQYNNKVLLLVNGHPMYEVVNGSFHLEMIPIRAIERIEVIRGPGSALYGTNAFAGVINIITKSQGGEVDAEGGSFDTFGGGFSFGSSDEKSGYLLAGSSRDDGGYPYRVARDEQGKSGSFDYANRVTNGFASLRFGDFRVNAAGFDQRKQKFGITPALAYNGPTDYQGGFLDLAWQRKLTEELTVGARLRYDRMKRENDIGHFPKDDFAGHADAHTVMYTDGDLMAGDAWADWKATPSLSILGGVVFERLSTEPYEFRFHDDDTLHPYSAYLDSHDTNDTSVFGQAVWNLTEQLSAVVGFRASDNSDSGSSFAPRAGIVYSPTEKTSLKLLYGEAYRNPNFFEKYVATYNVLYGFVDLEPERIRNVDLVLDHTFNGFNVRFDAFYLETDDLIVRVPTSRPDVTGAAASEYVNSSGDRNWGLEIEAHGPLGPNATFFVNYAALRAERRDSGDRIDYVPEHSGSLGLSWKASKFLFVHPNVKVVSAEGKAGGYTLVNLRLTVPLNDRFSLSLVGRNLTDREYAYPEYLRERIATIPGGAGRAFYGEVAWRF